MKQGTMKYVFLQQYFKRKFANAMHHKIIFVNYNAAIVKTYLFNLENLS